MTEERESISQTNKREGNVNITERRDFLKIGALGLAGGGLACRRISCAIGQQGLCRCRPEQQASCSARPRTSHCRNRQHQCSVAF